MLESFVNVQICLNIALCVCGPHCTYYGNVGYHGNQIQAKRRKTHIIATKCSKYLKPYKNSQKKKNFLET